MARSKATGASRNPTAEPTPAPGGDDDVGDPDGAGELDGV
jgi:hypothetical protein